MTGTGDPGELLRRSVVLAGHRTSISIERAFWDALKEIAAAEGVSLNRLVTDIDRARPGNLSSAVRLFVLQRARAGAPIACATTPPKRP